MTKLGFLLMVVSGLAISAAVELGSPVGIGGVSAATDPSAVRWPEGAGRRGVHDSGRSAALSSGYGDQLNEVVWDETRFSGRAGLDSVTYLATGLSAGRGFHQIRRASVLLRPWELAGGARRTLARSAACAGTSSVTRSASVTARLGTISSTGGDYCTSVVARRRVRAQSHLLPGVGPPAALADPNSARIRP